jgi:uncharacterized metal-binding protein YceD (DUF177 family)
MTKKGKSAAKPGVKPSAAARTKLAPKRGSQPRLAAGRDSARSIGHDASVPSGLAASPPGSLPWSVPLAVDAIPGGGLHRDIAADAAACAAVAAQAEVRTVAGLSAALDLMLATTEGAVGELIHITGRVRARVGQTCVVTLEPIETEVDEPIDITFAAAPAGHAAPTADTDPHRHEVDDAPEPLIGGMLDLGAIATEFLILGIDPYPRKAGVEFTPLAVEDDTPHPFAALAALKNRSGGDKA